MLIDFIASLLEKELPFVPTQGQCEAVSELAGFIAHTDLSGALFVLDGYAGTGKTSLLQAVVHAAEKLQVATVLLAPTGRAAKVMSAYAQRPAHTIHRYIYRQGAASGAYSRFELSYNKLRNAIFIVDEASMISASTGDSRAFGSGNLLDDLFSFVYSGPGCKLIMTGDTAQLPPVGEQGSPALDGGLLAREYLKASFSARLTEVMRQQQASGILHNATMLRQHIENGAPSCPKFALSGFADILAAGGQDLPELVEKSYAEVGRHETLLITRSNKRASAFNSGIRQQVLWKEESLSAGDIVMVVKNNYQGFEDCPGIDFIANGDTAEVVSVSNFHEMFGLNFADAVLKFPDHGMSIIKKRVITDTLNSETAGLSQEQSFAFFKEVEQDYIHEKNKRKRYELIKSDPYYSALHVKFAYAVTCHKAQGGQWHTVFVDHGYLPDPQLSIEDLRWLYTAVTRARKRLYLVSFNEDFIGH
jgi:exodeoxyribonuclease V